MKKARFCDGNDKVGWDVRGEGDRSSLGHRNCSESKTIKKTEAARLPVSRVVAACSQRTREQAAAEWFRDFTMAGSSAEKGEGCKTPSRQSISSERDACERGSWTPSRKGHGSGRIGGEKCEGSRKVSSSEREFVDTSEGVRPAPKKGAAKDRDPASWDASDRTEECRSPLKKGLNFIREENTGKGFSSRRHSAERERTDREIGRPLLPKRDWRDREGMFKASGSEKEVLEKGEGGIKLLSLKAFEFEREGRGKAHWQSHSSPSSKGAKYEKMTQFPKGVRSERDKSRREDGSKPQGRDPHSWIKSAGETLPYKKQNSADISVFEAEAKYNEEEARLVVSGVASEAETARKSEGSCLPRDAGRAEGELKATDTHEVKDSLTPEKSEMEEGELDPEEEDDGKQQIVEGKAIEDVQVSGEVKGEDMPIDEVLILEEASCSPKVVTQDAEATTEGDRKNNSMLEIEAEKAPEKETKSLMEIEAVHKIEDADEGRCGRGSEEGLEDSGSHDEVMVVKVEEKDYNSEPGEHILTLTDAKDTIFSEEVTKEGFKAVLETEIVDKNSNKAGASGHLDSQELVDVGMESEDRHLRKKQKVDKLEPPFLSLSLPDTLLSLGSPGAPQCPPVPRNFSKTKSMQSISASEAHSNGVTTSLSLSCSHPFTHNPSCSLTQTSLDNQEFSTASQQVSQGNDQLSYGSWQISHGSDRARSQKSKAVSFERRKPHRELPLYQQLLQNGNLQILQGSLGAERGKEIPSEPDNKGSRRSFGLEKAGSNPVAQGNRQLPPSIQKHKSNLEGSQGRSLDERGGPFERHRSLQKDFQERSHCGWSSPSQSVGSWEKWPELQNSGKGRRGAEIETSKLENGFSGKAPAFERNEDLSVSRNNIYGEKVSLMEIVTDPIPLVSKKLSELPESYVDGLKESLEDMLGTFEKREEFAQLQRILQRRTDLLTETLLRAHRAQLELLVSMKTGIPAFLHRDNSLTTSAMIEVFLQTRCRNIHCQSQLPADDCECPICSQKNGFCSACMCVVCSKFDFDANTCRWVGCDFCMHWCHTDCGLRSSYILPGQSIRGAAGTSEMQFRCMACGQKSELFGFVKDVFTTCAQDWGRDVLARELECVHRIFHGSEDKRGKQLCEKAELMLSKLESRADTAEVCRSMLRFFTDGEMETGNLWDRSKNSAVSVLHENKKSGDAVRESLYMTKATGMDQSTDLEKARTALQTYDRELEEKRTEAAEIQYDKARKKAEIEELESLVRIKQAESQMFQVRADEARREAEGLRRIVLAKCDKIQDEYASKIMKLRLNESEERRRKRTEELQMSERSAFEFNNMKGRVIADIQELLKKMEATKRQFL